MLLYIDTNVYLDVLLGRTGRWLDDAAGSARLLTRAVGCEFNILVSDIVIDEACRLAPTEAVQGLFSWLAPKVKRCRSTAADRRRARRIPTHFLDAMHVALAGTYGADAIVTRNVKDFVHATRLPVLRPEAI